MPLIQSAHFILRPLTKEDAIQIFELRSNDEVNKYLDRPKAKDLTDALKFIHRINQGIKNKEWYYWGIVPKDGEEIIGTICIWNIILEKRKAEIGYELLPAFQGKGIMREVLAPVIKFGFENLQMTLLDAFLHPDNLKSISVLENYGFQRDLPAESILDPANKNRQIVIYKLEKKHYKLHSAQKKQPG